MALKTQTSPGISGELLEAIQTLPLQKKVEHCGIEFAAPPFDRYADCPRCAARIKLRSFSACPEIEDVFDAVLEWMNRPGAESLAKRRMLELSEED